MKIGKGVRFFSSECVGMGHPDKVADQISDAVLDAMIKEDKFSRVACETLVKTGMAIIAGEVTTTGYVDLPEVVRQTIKEIGYNSSDVGFDFETCAVISCIEKQSPDIAMGVNKDDSKAKHLGAGDQGIMFGFACNETPELMPMALMLSRQILNKAGELRNDGTLGYLRPDSKSQLTVEYHDGIPKRIHTVVCSHQHDPNVDMAQLKEDLINKVVKQVVPAELLDDETIYHINPTGRFVFGGPNADCGLTGRKIIVDTYGGMGRHGGGAFSGKDPTKVDRSASYAARHAAKNIVAAGLADRCEIQLGYAIGVDHPLSIKVDTFDTGKLEEEKIENIVNELFDFTPEGMIERLNLRTPIYKNTARFGHFGIIGDGRTWEELDMVEVLKDKAGL